MAARNHQATQRSRSWVFALVASLLWLGAWMSIRGAFAVWAIMFVLYVFALAATILFGPTRDRSPEFGAWRERFFRTGGWVVLSGLLSLAYVIIAGLVFLLIALLTGRL